MSTQSQSGTARSLDTEVQYLKGVGPRLALLFAKLRVHTVRDLLWHFPRRYEDRTNMPPISAARPGSSATIRGKVADIETKPTRGGMVILRVTIGDGTGYITLVWFNQPWMRKRLATYKGDLLAYGQVREANWGYEIHNPEVELIEDEADAEDFARIVPVYSLTEGLQQRNLRRAAKSALADYLGAVEDPIPEALLRRHKLKPIRWSLHQIHSPQSDANRIEARRRLVFEEFFYMQLSLQLKRKEVRQELGIAFDISNLAPQGNLLGLFADEKPLADGETLWDELHRLFPFALTGAQKRVIGEVWADMERPQPMNRLIQGDVGSGKTAVAAAAMLAAIRCGYQAAMMAPTEILAGQHAMNLRALFDPLGIEVVLLTSKLPAAQKKRALAAAANGEAKLIVGTHALIQEGVKMHRLGLAVVDEQHRFGVMQRAALRQKGDISPDVLVMTATPIPRTLTMTFYGDLDVSILDELPPGRTPIKTHWKPPGERKQVYTGVRKLLEEGRQAYFVCPMISESEKMQTQAAEDLHYRLSTDVFKDLRVGLLHGQMKQDEKETTMNAFRAGELDILVSTVVIEVGVDVPNATVMIIEDANRFGLAQLHQLRGRVGRGGHQSYCVLIADDRAGDSGDRLRILTQTTDGFKIAEEDLRLRGPGEIAGTRQSGDLDFAIADLVQDAKMLEFARQAAIELLEADPELKAPEHRRIVQRVRAQRTESAIVTIS